MFLVLQYHFSLLLPIIPIAYIISQHYHVKDTLFKKLHSQVVTDEVILANLKELIIITDPDFHILSVNDSVERTLKLSRAELLDKYIFDVLLLKDSAGKIVDKKTFFPQENTKTAPEIVEEDFILFRSPFAKRNVSIRVQPIQDVENNISQLSFIINFNTQTKGANVLADVTEKARTKYEAIVEYIKKKLDSPTPELQEIKMEMIMLQKIENDMYHVQLLKELPDLSNVTHIDIAQLSKQIILQGQPLATSLKVPLEFKINNFGQKDIAPLTVKNFQVNPEELTGPFFTVLCNVRYMELIIKKIVDICLLSSATVKNPYVTLTLERGDNDTLLLKATASCPELTNEDIADIFVPYYGNLSKKTYLNAGSGLEGFLLRSASDALNLHLDVNNEKNTSSTINFTLTLTKNNNTQPTKNPD